MKLYEILNEKYLGRRFLLVEESIKAGISRKVSVNEKGQYGYVWEYVYDGEIVCDWSLEEKLICSKIKLIETEEENFNKITDEHIEITKDLFGTERILVVEPNCKSLNAFKSTHKPIYIRINDKQMGLNFDEFELISSYVERLKEFR